MPSSSYPCLIELSHAIYALKQDVAETLLNAMLKRPDRIGASAELTRLIVELEKLDPRPALFQVLLDALVSKNRNSPDVALLESLRATRLGRQVAQQVLEHLQGELARNPSIAQVSLAALPPAFASCCQDCAAFARFYREAAATATAATSWHILRAKESQRRHLKKRITDAQLGLQLKELHTGSPYSLIVTLPAAFVAHRERKTQREELEKWMAALRRLVG